MKTETSFLGTFVFAICSTVAQAQGPLSPPLEEKNSLTLAQVSVRFVDPQSRPLENVLLWFPKQSVPRKRTGKSHVVLLKSGQFHPSCVVLTLADVLEIKTEDSHGHWPVTNFFDNPANSLNVIPGSPLSLRFQNSEWGPGSITCAIHKSEKLFVFPTNCPAGLSNNKGEITLDVRPGTTQMRLWWRGERIKRFRQQSRSISKGDWKLKVQPGINQVGDIMIPHQPPQEK